MEELLVTKKGYLNCAKNETAYEIVRIDPNYFDFKKKLLHIGVRPKSDLAKSVSSEFLMSRTPAERYNDPIKHARDSLLSTTMGFAVTKDAFMFKTFRDYIQRMFECGLLLKSDGVNWYNRMYERIYHESKEMVLFEKGSQHVVLGWNHLYAGFYVWLFAVVICTLVFLAEVVTYELMDFCQN